MNEHPSLTLFLPVKIRRRSNCAETANKALQVRSNKTESKDRELGNLTVKRTTKSMRKNSESKGEK